MKSMCPVPSRPCAISLASSRVMPPQGSHFVGAEAHAESEVLSHRLPDSRDQLQGEAHAVLEASRRNRRSGSSSGIGHELPGKRAVAELQLDAVEAAFPDMDGGAAEVVDHLFVCPRSPWPSGFP